jgi:hypothetical protein
MISEASVVRVIVNCPDCGNVKVAPTEVTMRHCLDDDQWSYWFICPSCHLRAAARTDRSDAVLDALSLGSALDPWRLPAELAEQHDGPALTTDDLEELHRQLTAADLTDHI